MSNGVTTINVVEWIITQNFWEYYVTDDTDGSIAFCLVHGFETELGYVCLEEIKPYIRIRTKDLTMQPAIGWEWVS